MWALFCLSPSPRLARHAAARGNQRHPGIPLGIGVIVISFILTGIYVWRANGEFDRLTKSINEVKA
jgi:uncharacterized membrane protein (DUF485 family)